MTMKKEKKILLEQGICECIYEPRGDGGLEGYSLNDNYKYAKLYDSRGVYYAVYPPGSYEYYETCGPGTFKKYFQIVDAEKERQIVCNSCKNEERMHVDSALTNSRKFIYLETTPQGEGMYQCNECDNLTLSALVIKNLDHEE